MLKKNIVFIIALGAVVFLFACSEKKPKSSSYEFNDLTDTQEQSDRDISVQGNSFSEKMLWMETNAQSDRKYIIELDTDESVAEIVLDYRGRSNVTIALQGSGANRIISFSSDVLPIDSLLTVRAMFTVGSGISLVLDSNITLKGQYEENIDSLVLVESNGTFIMNNGSKIIGSRINGVRVNGGTFIMRCGEISGNKGGGVRVAAGRFNMSDGKISGNNAPGQIGCGGGVYVSGGTFSMNGGEISGNRASGNIGYGGGVYVSSGTFTMSGGTISGNSAYGLFNSHGGGVSVSGGSFYMSGGTVSGNTASGGIRLRSTSGGGVYVSSGTFTMSGGIISGNTAYGNTAYGGGVYVAGGAGRDGFSLVTFTKSGGIITGYASDADNGNVVKDSSGNVQSDNGHAVYAYTKLKEITTGPGVNLSYNGSDGTFGGAWDN